MLARQPEGRIMLLDEIAKAGHLPPRFLSQIFQKLRRHNVVASHRGAIRGYSLARPAARITLREIFEAIEGPDLLDRCVFWPESCDGGRPCRLHGWWTALKVACQREMEAITLEEVAYEATRELADVAQGAAGDRHA